MHLEITIHPWHIFSISYSAIWKQTQSNLKEALFSILSLGLQILIQLGISISFLIYKTYKFSFILIDLTISHSSLSKNCWNIASSISIASSVIPLLKRLYAHRLRPTGKLTHFDCGHHWTGNADFSLLQQDYFNRVSCCSKSILYCIIDNLYANSLFYSLSIIFWRILFQRFFKDSLATALSAVD